MERKIGEIFENNGEWYQCVTQNVYGCSNCDLAGKCLDIDKGKLVTCHAWHRNDNTSVIFKKLEKVGEPITVKDRTFQKLTHDNTSCKECVFNIPNKACYKNDYIDGPCTDMEFWVEVKQTKEDMEEKNNGNTPLNVLTDKYVNGDICYDDFEKEVKALYSCKEENKPKLKPFDLEAAKAGKPVCTRDGRKARIICFDRKDNTPIVALIEFNHAEILQCFHNDGKCFHYDTSNNDLMMLPEKKEGWINVYRLNTCYKTKEEAEANIDRDYEDEYVRTVKINWEE